MWVCPKHAVQPRDVCTPSDVDGCMLDVFKVDDKFLEMREWGADHTVPVDGDQVARVMDLTDGKGVEVVIDFVGESGAEHWGVDLLRRHGYFFVVGYGGTLQVPTMQIILTEINFIGNLVGSYNDLVELMTLAAQGKVRLHSATYPLDDVNTAMDDLNNGRLRGRGILVP